MEARTSDGLGRVLLVVGGPVALGRWPPRARCSALQIANLARYPETPDWADAVTWARTRR